jgi:hypothetical protein
MLKTEEDSKKQKEEDGKTEGKKKKHFGLIFVCSANGGLVESTSSFKFARVWEVEKKDVAEEVRSDSAAFWANLLADERKRIAEQEEAKANM